MKMSIISPSISGPDGIDLTTPESRTGVFSRPRSVTTGNRSSSTGANTPEQSVSGTSPSQSSGGTRKLFPGFRSKTKDQNRSGSSSNVLSESPRDGKLSPGFGTPPKSLFWSNFRPRSKSESRPRVLVTSRSPMQSIPSLDEGAESPPLTPGKSSDPVRGGNEGVVRPLFIDTQLANRVTGTEKARRSPVARAVMDFVRGGSVRQRNDSSGSQNSVGYPSSGRQHSTHLRHISGPASTGCVDGYRSSRSPVNVGSGKPLTVAEKKLLMQRSLDSGLDVVSPSALVYRQDGTQLIPIGGRINNLAHQTMLLENEDWVYSFFMKAHKCYDLVPTSSKLVVFDTQLPVRKAFFALVYNGVRAAPLWDSEKQEFVGMLTITDFIHILVKYYKSGQGGIKELEEHKISTWIEVLRADGRFKSLVSIDPTETLHKAVQILIERRIHRLPVVDKTTGNTLYILTHKRILRFLYLYIHDLPRPSYLDKTPKELNIGTWGPVQSVSFDTPLIVALNKFLDHRVSALPVLNKDGEIIDIYAKFDVINLAAEKAYSNLEITVQEGLKHRSEWFEGVRKCLDTDSVWNVIEILVKAEVHRLVITDTGKRVVGIVSLSDILAHLILTPPDSGGKSEQHEEDADSEVKGS